jgi:hypothetical protein
LAAHGALAPAVVARLVELVASTRDIFARMRVGEVLVGQGELPRAVVDRLSQLAASNSPSAAHDALWHAYGC